MIIKFVLVAAIAAAAIVALRGNRSSVNLALRRLAAVLFVMVGAVAVAFPGTVTWVAERIGVGRGSDLVLYALALTFLFVTIGVHQRIQLLEGRLTVLTRQLALHDAHAAHAAAAQPGGEAAHEEAPRATA